MILKSPPFASPFTLRLAAFVAAFLLAACGGNPAYIAERSRAEAMGFRELTRQPPGLQGAEISRADSLVEQSAGYWKQGEAEKARLASEEAVALYQLALARDTKSRTEQELSITAAALAKDKDRLDTYREILAEMKTMRKP